jgi:hypothetical protein
MIMKQMKPVVVFKVGHLNQVGAILVKIEDIELVLK